MADPTIFWCSTCKKYHGGECDSTVASTEILTLRLGTYNTPYDGKRREYAELLEASNAVILIDRKDGLKVFKMDSWEKDGTSIRVNFKAKS
jgi:hypothetical protein